MKTMVNELLAFVDGSKNIKSHKLSENSKSSEFQSHESQKLLHLQEEISPDQLILLDDEKQGRY